jgi:hypothetical protein
VREPKADGLKLTIGYVEFDEIDQYRNAQMVGGNEMSLRFRVPEGKLGEWAAALGGRFRVVIEELGEDPGMYKREACEVHVAGIDGICAGCGRHLKGMP